MYQLLPLHHGLSLGHQPSGSVVQYKGGAAWKSVSGADRTFNPFISPGFESLLHGGIADGIVDIDEFALVNNRLSGLFDGSLITFCFDTIPIQTPVI